MSEEQINEMMDSFVARLPSEEIIDMVRKIVTNSSHEDIVVMKDIYELLSLWLHNNNSLEHEPAKFKKEANTTVNNNIIAMSEFKKKKEIEEILKGFV